MTANPCLLHELLDLAADQAPERIAVSGGGRVITYAELRGHSDRLARSLAADGLRRGDHVVLALAEAIELAPVLFALSRIGAVFVVIQEEIPARLAEHVLADAAPVLVVTRDPRLQELARRVGIRVADPDRLGDAALGTGTPQPPIAVDPACMIYTSGSTALPRAVVCTHQQMVFATHSIQSQLRYRRDDIVFCALPLSFDYGLYQLLLAVSAGAELASAPTTAAGPALLRRLRETRATVLPAVPSLAANLAMLLARSDEVPSDLRLLTNTGAALPAPTLAALRTRLPQLRIQVMYGLTECKRAAIMPPDGDLDRPGSCGCALPGTELIIVDEAGHQVPAGVTGEIVVRGPHVMSGYWHAPAATAERFRVVDGLFRQLHTGDFGRLDEDGFLYFHGRRDDLYKEHGFRVSAIEVVAAALAVAGVEAAEVVPPVQDSDGAVLVVAGRCTAAEVLRGMRDFLEAPKIPDRCLVLPELPLTAHGKVARAALVTLVRSHVT
ncbi:class I adenylate-forming enzyme family protein [Kribbella albertanoniae]|uniref:Long-chain fatty acid--CoA ligase n=1 Tax=Kribbella albertanoniae TaxID=1266829 RepID=A0A4R4QJP1_9ACTN|nr:AMP-binding protein [Kribbella albertanoniae]TDC35533.1 long-chain fatty acid--CoA ligase [Kribbella albertanoniae]